MKCGAGITAENYHHEWALMCDACYGQWEKARDREKMSWTTGYPTKPGFYWIRNYQLKGKGKNRAPSLTTEPAIVEVAFRSTFEFVGDERVFNFDQLIRAEWQGPIEPEIEKAISPPVYSLFPDGICTQCLQPSYRFISWPIGEVDGKLRFGLICPKCWIESLTPEKRKVYTV